MGEIKCRIKLRAKPKYEIFPFSTTSKTEAHFMQIKTRLNFRFKMTDLGKLFWFLGIQFECENSTIEMNQSRYIDKISSKFGIADCKPCSTLCEMDITKSDKVD